MEESRGSFVKLRPKTFEERGALMPFETEVLRFARVRNLAMGLEMLVPSLSGGEGVYVIPWRYITEVFPLPLHDRMLANEISARKAAYPHEIWQAWTQVRAKGAAGVDPMEQALKDLKVAEEQELLCKFFIVKDAIDRHGDPSQGKLSAADLITPKGHDLARKSLESFAAAVKLEPKEVLNHLMMIGEMIAPIAAPGRASVGRIGQILDRLNTFLKSMKDWSETESHEYAYMAKQVHQLSSIIYKQAKSTESKLLGFVERVDSIIPNWQKAEKEIRRLTGRTGWLADGWLPLLEIWEKAQYKERWEQQKALEQIVRFLPIMPEKEIEQDEAWRTYEVNMKKWMPMLHNWLTGEVDEELVKRLDKFKAS